MSRLSGDEMKDGKLFNGFDYEEQAWVIGGIYQDCGHPSAMKAMDCCHAHTIAGRKVA